MGSPARELNLATISSPANTLFQRHNDHSFLLNVPLEIAFIIVKFLPINSKITLSQSCRAFRSIIPQRAKVGDDLSDEDHLERLELIYCLARDRVDVWACHMCCRFHPVDVSDTPTQNGSGFCPKAYYYIDWRVNELNLFHHHVQLTLKYTRMKPERGSDVYNYLQKLLRPWHRAVDITTPGYDNLFQGRADYSGYHPRFYSTYPKVVNGHYMIFSTLRYPVKDKHPVLLIQSILAGLWLSSHNRKTVWWVYSLQDNACQTLYWSDQIDVISELLYIDGVEMMGSCHHCWTDYAITFDLGDISIRVWQNFGPEGTPKHPLWISHTPYGIGSRVNRPMGSACYMYEAAQQTII